MHKIQLLPNDSIGTHLSSDVVVLYNAVLVEKRGFIFWFVGENPTLGGTADEFGVEVGVEDSWKPTDMGIKMLESINDVGRC